MFGEPTLGDAILDRIVHNAYRLELDGPSMRKIKASEAADPAPVAPPAADPKAPKGAKRCRAGPACRPPPWVNRNLPTRAAASAMGALRGARGSLLLTTGTASNPLDRGPED